MAIWRRGVMGHCMKSLRDSPLSGGLWHGRGNHLNVEE